MRYLGVAVAGAIGGACLSPSQPLPVCVEELYVVVEAPLHVRCMPGALLEADGPVITCKCVERKETRLAGE